MTGLTFDRIRLLAKNSMDSGNLGVAQLYDDSLPALCGLPSRLPTTLGAYIGVMVPHNCASPFAHIIIYSAYSVWCDDACALQGDRPQAQSFKPRSPISQPQNV